MAQTGPIPQRPYLLRAMHAWITDNGQTPHVVVDASVENVQVPEQYIRDGKIVLNISYNAVSGLDIGNEAVTFQARFSGASYGVYVPVSAVLGIYARETGHGMIFAEEEAGKLAGELPPDDPPDGPPAGNGTTPGPGSRKSHLKVVK